MVTFYTFRAALFGIPLAVLLAVSQAQSPPSLSLSRSTLAPGQAFTLEASRLEPDSPYTLTLNGPDDAVIETVIRSDGNGDLKYRGSLDIVGPWTLHLEGPGLNALFGIEVEGLPSAPADTSPTEGVEPAPGEPADLTPLPDEPTEPNEVPPEPPNRTSPVDFSFELDGDDLVARSGDRVRWRLDFPPESGASVGPLLAAGAIYLGHGYSVLELDPATGTVVRRLRLSGPIGDLSFRAGAIVIGVDHGDDLSEEFVLNGSDPEPQVRFGSTLDMFNWLRREAEVADPSRRLQQDPTNPWLHLQVGLEAEFGGARRDAFEAALNQAETFFERAQLAQVLFREGDSELAGRAMEAAYDDFAARSYDPRLVTELALHEAYGFPLRRFESALARGGLVEAGFWAPWVHLLSANSVPATGSALREYARQLRVAGDRDEAALWRTRANLPGRRGIATILDDLFTALGRIGWYAVASLLIAIVALHLTLVAKYWRPQTVLAQGRSGGGPAPWARLLAIRYYSFTEKLVLVLMFASSLALAGLADWQSRSEQMPAAWRSGTMASAAALAQLDALEPDAIERSGVAADSAVTLFIRGYAQHSAGDEAAASYRQAGDHAPSVNNLAAIQGDVGLFERALELDARLPEARFNLGRIADPSPFHLEYHSAAPLLAVPTPIDLQTAFAGTWQNALARAFTDPWSVLTEAEVPGFGGPRWLWWGVLVLFFLAAAASLLWLVVPRPRLARNAPRTLLYQLLALLIPGSGLADELWGVLLLTPWAIFGLDALASYFAWGFGLNLGFTIDLVVLGLLYVVNTVAFVVEFGSYNRRMNELKRNDPETALRFGLRVREPTEE